MGVKISRVETPWKRSDFFGCLGHHGVFNKLGENPSGRRIGEQKATKKNGVVVLSPCRLFGKFSALLFKCRVCFCFCFIQGYVGVNFWNRLPSIAFANICFLLVLQQLMKFLQVSKSPAIDLETTTTSARALVTTSGCPIPRTSNVKSTMNDDVFLFSGVSIEFFLFFIGKITLPCESRTQSLKWEAWWGFTRPCGDSYRVFSGTPNIQSQTIHLHLS